MSSGRPQNPVANRSIISSSSNAWKSFVEGSPLGPCQLVAGDQGRQRKRAWRGRPDARRSSGLRTFSCLDQARDSRPGTSDKLGWRLIKIGDNAGLEPAATLRRRHLLKFSCSPNPSAHRHRLPVEERQPSFTRASQNDLRRAFIVRSCAISNGQGLQSTMPPTQRDHVRRRALPDAAT
jgi:hypothetical protein